MNFRINEGCKFSKEARVLQAGVPACHTKMATKGKIRCFVVELMFPLLAFKLAS
jgi:hypothetical protein